MNIGIDGNEANLSRRVGVGQFGYQLLTHLYLQDSTNNYTIYLKSAPLPDMPPPRPNWRYLVFGPSPMWTKFALPLRLFFSLKRPDYFYSLGHYSPHFSPVPVIPTIHDLGYLDTPSQFTQKDYYQLVNWTRRSISKATHIAAVSEFTKNEIIRIYKVDPASISVIPNGVDPPPSFTKTEAELTLKKFHIKSPYFLTVGTLKPNKNIPLLLEAFSLYLKTNPSPSPILVIAGKKGWLFDEIFSTVTRLNLKNNVIFTDFITESEKWHLYSRATASLLVSTYEGFGIPVIESQIVGTPVIASSIPALIEVLKTNALFVDPTNAASISEAMTEISKPTKRQALSVAGVKSASTYSWNNSAQLLIKMFSQLFGRVKLK
ncbi:MAG: glycosyltransferase family 1 protein [Candidatus Shapirobacteria bacterium]